MTDTLWLRFAEDAGLPQVMTVEEQAILSRIFDVTLPESLWRAAIHRAGLRLQPNTHHLRWLQGSPYINWSAVVGIIGGGWMTTRRAGQDQYTYTTSKDPIRFLSFLWVQFRLSLYLAQRLKAPLPIARDEQIIESLALGIALLALTMRLPAHDGVILAGWLAEPEKSPARKTLQDMQAIQLRRTHLSQAWKELFPVRPDPDGIVNLPSQFWNEPPDTAETLAVGPASAISWRGLPVSGGTATGRAVLVGRDMQVPESNDPLILVFARARPDSTELFGRAAAVVYAEGGALSHACTVAREQGVTCVTGVGRGILGALGGQSVWLRVDGQAGTVDIIG